MSVALDTLGISLTFQSTVKANMAATDAEKMSDEELLAQMSCVFTLPNLICYQT